MLYLSGTALRLRTPVAMLRERDDGSDNQTNPPADGAVTRDVPLPRRRQICWRNDSKLRARLGTALGREEIRVDHRGDDFLGRLLCRPRGIR